MARIVEIGDQVEVNGQHGTVTSVVTREEGTRVLVQYAAGVKKEPTPSGELEAVQQWRQEWHDASELKLAIEEATEEEVREEATEEEVREEVKGIEE